MDTHRRKRFIGIGSIILLFVGTVIAGAKVTSSNTAQIKNDLPLSQQAKTKPISNTLITLQITFDSGEVVEASQREGGLIRITRNGLIIGLTPYITNHDNKTVAVKLFRIDQIKKGGAIVGEEIEEIDVQTLDSNSLIRFREPNIKLTAQLLSIEKEPKPKQGNDGTNLIRPIEDTGGGQCCLNCDNIDTCACRVRTSCGRCCAPPCCD